MVCAAAPGRKTDGCRSSAQPLARTSRACAPRNRSVVRCAETSTAAPSCSATAAFSCASRSSPPRVLEVTSHSSGPNQITVVSAPSTAVDAAVGSAATPSTPAAAAPPAPLGSTHRSTIVTQGSSASWVEEGSSANRDCQSCRGLWRERVSAIAACSFGIDQDAAGDLHGHQPAVHGNVQGFSDAGVPTLDQGQGERPAQLRAAVTGGDLAEHRYRRRGKDAVGAGLDDLGALGKHGLRIDGQQPDELLAQRVEVLGAGERP